MTPLLPGPSFFFNLKLRAALRAYVVLWYQPLKQNPFHKLITDRGISWGFVSAFCLLKSSYKDLPLDRLWIKDVLEWKPDFDRASANVLSRNPDHQQIHLYYSH